MQIAIVHYHLNRGGVTQVIVNHLRALSATVDTDGPVRVAILYGGRRHDWPEQVVAALPGVETTLCEVPLLEYDSDNAVRERELFAQITQTLGSVGMTAADTVLHVHNHALGKNRSLPGAVAGLARDGHSLLLQIHDFSEDSRPDNYRALADSLTPNNPAALADLLYPQSPAIHYALLNGRDLALMRLAGVRSQRLHALPNPVSDFHDLPEKEHARRRLKQVLGLAEDVRYYLYPVRGIRRKNLGEALLWSAVADRARTRLALTLPPLNPLEKPRYEFWKQLAKECHLPFLFEVGAEGGLSFGQNLVAADMLITTSIAEGFGMVFLECWLAGRDLIGRDLPEITADFVAAGMDLSQLQPQVRVPLDWVGRQAFEEDLELAYRRILEAYDQPCPTPAEFSRQAEELVHDGLLDFARLSARLQSKVIAQVASDPGRRERLTALNGQMPAQLTAATELARQRVEDNAAVVRGSFSLASTGRRLRQLYQQILASPHGDIEHLDSGFQILHSFLGLPRVHPIRID
jgi:hypothetical protein